MPLSRDFVPRPSCPDQMRQDLKRGRFVAAASELCLPSARRNQVGSRELRRARRWVRDGHSALRPSVYPSGQGFCHERQWNPSRHQQRREGVTNSVKRH